MPSLMVPEPKRLPWPPEENSKHANIDGDIIVYHICFSCEEEPLEIAKATMNAALKDIVRDSGCGTWTVHLTGTENFREEFATIQPYKGNREGRERPLHYPDIRQYLLDEWSAVLHPTFEADDAMSISHYYASAPLDEIYAEHEVYWSPNPDKQQIIVTLDKDLKGVRGASIFNWDKNEFYNLTEVEAMRFFYTQCLTGDSTDHIKGLTLTRPEAAVVGLRSVGPKSKWVEPLQFLDNEADMYEHVLGAYEHFLAVFRRFEGELSQPQLNMLEMGAKEALKENATLLHMMRYPDERWEAP